MLVHIRYCTRSLHVPCMLVHIGYCTQSPCVHFMPWHTQYCRWNFLRDMVGFIESDKVRTIFELLICTWCKISALDQSNNYELCNLLPSINLNHIVQTNSHFTSELLICTVDDLTISNLIYAARLLDSQRPTLMASMKFSKFIFHLGLKFFFCQAVNLHCKLQYAYFMFPTH